MLFKTAFLLLKIVKLYAFSFLQNHTDVANSDNNNNKPCDFNCKDNSQSTDTDSGINSQSSEQERSASCNSQDEDQKSTTPVTCSFNNIIDEGSCDLK